MERLRCVSYARYSSQNQRDESLQLQQETIRSYCMEKHYSLIYEYADAAFSGTNDSRPQFQKMMLDAQDGKFDAVAVYKLDRFSRSFDDHLRYKSLLENFDILLISVCDGCDETTPEGKLFTIIQMGMSQYYVANLKRETMRGILANAKKGKLTGGVPALGFRVDKELNYHLEEWEAEAVRIIFKMTLKGIGSRLIANHLNEKGYRTKSGKPFRAAFTDILNNRKYLGEYTYNRAKSTTAIGKRNNRESKDEKDIIRIPHAIPRIIDDKTFKAVQVIMEKRRKRNGLEKRHYLLSGFITCAYSGYAMSGTGQKCGRAKILRVSYRCNPKASVDKVAKDVNVSYLDEFALNLLDKTLLNIHRAESIHKILKAVTGNNFDRILKRIKRLDKEHKELKDEMDNAVARVSSTEVARLQKLLSKIKSTQENIDNNQNETGQLAIELDNALYSNKEIVLKNITLYRTYVSGGDKENIREVLKKLIHRIYVSDEEIAIKIKAAAYMTTKQGNGLGFTIVIPRNHITLESQHYKQEFDIEKMDIRYDK